MLKAFCGNLIPKSAHVVSIIIDARLETAIAPFFHRQHQTLPNEEFQFCANNGLLFFDLFDQRVKWLRKEQCAQDVDLDCVELDHFTFLHFQLYDLRLYEMQKKKK